MWLQRSGALCGVPLGLSIAVPGAIEAFTGETAATGLVLGAAVLGAGLAAHRLDPSSAGFEAGVLGLAGVELLDRRRPRRALLAARLAVLIVVAR